MTIDPSGPNALTSAETALERCVASAESTANLHTFISTDFERARSTAASIDRLRSEGVPPPHLAGWVFSIKDLFDVSGEVTGAGSTVLAQDPPASADCPAVHRLRQAGAVFIGRTNMSEFAFSGVGLNPHFGTPANAATALLDAEPRIPGGSTSGGAVSVATGAARAALGSDTGGSIRIPAALQGLVGFKNTARLTPTQGAVPLSTTLDTVCAITRTVGDAISVHRVLAQRDSVPVNRPLSSLRIGIPTTSMLDSLDDAVARAFQRSLSALAAAGARVEEVRLGELADAARINATGGFSAAESWAWHRKRLVTHEAEYDPRVALRIRRGETMSAADYIDLSRARVEWIDRMSAAVEGFDVMIGPTVPIVAPPIAPLERSDDAFFATNALLLRNPSLVNLLDGCALSLPCHAPDEMPVGLMVWSTAMRDDAVLGASLAIEAALASITAA